MILRTKSLIKEGSVSSTSSLLLVADMFLEGSIMLSMTFIDCDTTKTLVETFESIRDGYNAFYRVLDVGTWNFVDIEILEYKGVRLVTDFFINTQGEIAA